jgi:hypothetical protein
MMLKRTKSGIALGAALLALLLVAGCSEINRTAAPVELIATNTQNVMVIDLLNLPTESIGEITLRAITKRPAAEIGDLRLLDVRLRSYRVTYRRTDGGSLVPQGFVRSISGIIPVNGGPTAIDDFLIVEGTAINQAPFAALLPQNGGRDPETGQPIVKMDAIVDIFGETLAGDAVSARTTIPLWFCAGCGGA